VECNRLAVDIDNEMAVVHAFIKDKYRLKFPELESLVHAPVEYARVVRRIGNEADLTAVDLDDLLPAGGCVGGGWGGGSVRDEDAGRCRHGVGERDAALLT